MSLDELIRYEVPILKHITKHYEQLGYSHANAEQIAVEYYSEELRKAYEQGVNPETELLIIDKQMEFERIIKGYRRG